LLAEQIPIVERLKEIELTYKDKVILSLAMGLNEEFKAALIGIGEIRNKFAHRPNYELSKQDVNNLYKSFPTNEKELIHKCIKTVNNTEGESVQFNSLPPRGKFTIMAITLRQILVAALDKWSV
jgi:adenine-specific DNA methylase